MNLSLRWSLVLGGMIGIVTASYAQMKRINKTIQRVEAESHLRFLAADELRGRNTGTTEINIAARYIAEQFRRFGLIPLGDDADDFLQKVKLEEFAPPQEASLQLLDQSFKTGDNLVCLDGFNGTLSGPAIYVANPDSLEDNHARGKFVVAVIRDRRVALYGSPLAKKLRKAGALGLIHIYGPGQQYPWAAISNYLSRPRVKIDESSNADGTASDFQHVWISDPQSEVVKKLIAMPESNAAISIDGLQRTPLISYNVVGKIEGSDQQLKKEHLLMCAHYDHVGVQSGEGQDSIFNGTRDNAIGTTGLINAAHYLSKYPPKRSVIVIALTAEEKGLLGSQYYTDHPRIPLQETVFALNIDNSGYTDTRVMTLLDTNRTNIDPLVYQAAGEVGLGVTGDRFPGQNYFERSDQASFAKKGVPAINFKMGMTAFDERITTYYHQPADEIKHVDLDYIYKYWRAYIRTAELIGNWKKTPYWVAGDKFEAAGNKLYNR